MTNALLSSLHCFLPFPMQPSEERITVPAPPSPAAAFSTDSADWPVKVTGRMEITSIVRFTGEVSIDEKDEKTRCANTYRFTYNGVTTDCGTEEETVWHYVHRAIEQAAKGGPKSYQIEIPDQAITTSHDDFPRHVISGMRQFWFPSPEAARTTSADSSHVGKNNQRRLFAPTIDTGQRSHDKRRRIVWSNLPVPRKGDPPSSIEDFSSGDDDSVFGKVEGLCEFLPALLVPRQVVRARMKCRSGAPSA